jgi:hypothetical protein
VIVGVLEVFPLQSLNVDLFTHLDLSVEGRRNNTRPRARWGEKRNMDSRSPEGKPSSKLPALTTRSSLRDSFLSIMTLRFCQLYK